MNFVGYGMVLSHSFLLKTGGISTYLLSHADRHKFNFAFLGSYFMASLIFKFVLSGPSGEKIIPWENNSQGIKNS